MIFQQTYARTKFHIHTYLRVILYRHRKFTAPVVKKVESVKVKDLAARKKHQYNKIVRRILYLPTKH